MDARKLIHRSRESSASMTTIDLKNLPDKSVRIVMWGEADEVLYDRVFFEYPTIPQLKEIRDVAKSAMGESESSSS